MYDVRDTPPERNDVSQRCSCLLRRLPSLGRTTELSQHNESRLRRGRILCPAIPGTSDVRLAFASFTCAGVISMMVAGALCKPANEVSGRAFGVRRERQRAIAASAKGLSPRAPKGYRPERQRAIAASVKGLKD